MLSRKRAWFLLGASVLALGAGCKARETAGQDSRPLPTPEPPASSAALPRDETPVAPKKRVSDEGTKEAPSKVTRPADVPASPVGAAGSTTTAPGNSGGATNAAAGGAANTAVPALPSAPTFTPPSAACLARCQGAMQGCLTAPVDGGVPGFANLDLCKKAFEACQSACK